MDSHCDRPGTCACGPLGCNCGCYICSGGPQQGFTKQEWKENRKNRIEHLEKLLAAGETHENGYPIKETLWLMRILSDPEEDE